MTKTERQQEAVRLSLSGCSIREIAEQLGSTEKTIKADLKRHINAVHGEISAGATWLRATWHARYEALLQAVWNEALAGDRDSLAAVLKIGAQASKLHGLDAPQKVAPTSPDGDEAYGMPDSAVADRIQEILAVAAQRKAAAEAGEE